MNKKTKKAVKKFCKKLADKAGKVISEKFDAEPGVLKGNGYEKGSEPIQLGDHPYRLKAGSYQRADFDPEATPLHVRITESERAEIEAAAAKEGRTVSSFVKNALKKYISLVH